MVCAHDITSIFGPAPSPEGVQEILGSMRYHNPDFYGVRSALCALASGEAHCLEAALVAALLMESRGHKPRILGLYGNAPENVRDSAHAVYVYASADGYCSLGKSRYPELEARLRPFPTIDALAQSYRDGFAHRGIELEYWTLLNPDRLRGFDRDLLERNWRTGDGNLGVLNFSLMLGKRFYLAPRNGHGGVNGSANGSPGAGKL